MAIIAIFVNNIVPILLVAGVGWIAGTRFKLDTISLGRFVFYVLSPALVLDSLSRNRMESAEIGWIALVVVLVAVCMALVSWMVARFMGWKGIDRASVMLGSVCPNNGNLGLPLVAFAFDDNIFVRAVIVYVVTTILNYSLGIAIASSGHGDTAMALKRAFSAPAVYAAFIGLALSRTPFALPLALERSIGLLAQATIPLMLVVLGIKLSQVRGSQHISKVSAVVVLKLVVAPVLAFVTTMLLPVPSSSAIAIIIQLGAPTAVVTTIFATEFMKDVDHMAAMVLATTLISPLTMSALILWLR